MNIQVTSFTETGKELANKIFKSWGPEKVFFRQENSLKEWTRQGFLDKNAIIFVGAAGIATRSIAPFVESKLTDPPVIVIDELGRFVIPILSGHVGGANELAIRIADRVGARPIITTATDINNKFAVDVWAKEHNLEIMDKAAIADISSRILASKKITIYLDFEDDKKPLSFKENAFDNNIVLIYNKDLNNKDLNDKEMNNNSKNTEAEDIINDKLTNKKVRGLADIVVSTDEDKLKRAKCPLRPKTLILGIGCKKGKSYDEIMEIINENNIDLSQIHAIASIDIKANEEGLLTFANRNRVKFCTFSSEALMALQGEFSASEFVKSQTGVDNVCERAALLAAGDGGKLLIKKQAKNGVTLAVAQRDWTVDFNE